ncbi:hypothetical protein [Paenibacillus kandeliae]|uniref:hypothetical protein n=1 Tax=Paenibacillus kandeliae TaxID=3231269 RepID=UPI0034586507
MNKTSIVVIALTCSVIIGLSIVSGFYILSTSANARATTESDHSEAIPSSVQMDVMNEQEVAAYLGVDVADVEAILQKDKATKQQMGGGIYDLYQFLPYLQTASGKKMFYKKHVDGWVDYQTQKYNPASHS